ncbi:hypothetical protein WN51_11244 [Melipona quadrifasciata]|uniref:Uncharacterized protein n=1 Tax=Melipona quadrifasciata TaxID=166423 RepID=A0A0N0BHQ8_9HYME|nr:hypothetical protein WN51_11244 [Melipona quadrifasciata]
MFKHDQQPCDDYRKRHGQIGDLGSDDIRGSLFLFWTSPGDGSLVERGTNSRTRRTGLPPKPAGPVHRVVASNAG